jgi:hypothetical protein
MKHTRIALLVLAMLATAAIVPVAQADDNSEQVCRDTIDQTIADFNTYPDGLPAEVAGAGVAAIYRDCYVPDVQAPAPPQPEPLQAEPLNLEGASLDKMCSGWGETNFGWEEGIQIYYYQWTILAGPMHATSAKFAYTPDTNSVNAPPTFVSGYLMSPLDTIEVTIAKTSSGPKQEHAWTFANVPMDSWVGLNVECWNLISRYSEWSAGGMPYGSDVIHSQIPLLSVWARGKACFAGLICNGN